MKIHIYQRDEAGLITYGGTSEWDSLDAYRDYYGLDARQGEEEVLAGWPTANVTWYGRQGVRGESA